METLFLISFALHNMEEAIWLPGWRQQTGNYYPQVSKKSFYTALITVTAGGYLITLLSLLFGRYIAGFKYAFLGLTIMMGLNAIFPHLFMTIKLRRYAPGTLTGLLLNLPVGIIAVFQGLGAGMEAHLIVLSGVMVATLTIFSLRHWFKVRG